MFALTNQAGGKCMGFPDVCKTPAPPAPPVPIPYPNIAMTEAANAITCSLIVKIAGMSAFTQKTQWKMSMGDEAGIAGGIVSGKNMTDVGFVMGSVIVKIEGSPAVFQTNPTKHNGTNPNFPMGSALQAPQFVVDISM
jgi:hypothetical protein